MDEVKRNVRRTVYTTGYLRAASWHALERARRHERGFCYDCMTAILFSAFCLEAYFNHLGEEIMPFWSEIERSLGPRQKLLVLADQVKFELDFGRRPFQSFTLIFRVRNALAHGRTEHLYKDEAVEMPQTEWEEQVTVQNAERYLDDTRDMIELLQDGAGLDITPLWLPATAAWWEE